MLKKIAIIQRRGSPKPLQKSRHLSLIIKFSVMKKVRVILTCAVFALGITGVVVAKANENKKRVATATNIYYATSGGSATLLQSNSNAKFTVDDSGNQAQILGKNGTTYFFWEDASKTEPVYFVP
jgi:hypothetical protein